METVLHHALLALAVLGLADAAVRLASLVTPSELERVVVAVTFGVAVAVLEALALGVVSLGADSLALAAAAGVTWAAARVLLPRPAVSPAEELFRWWAGLDLAGRMAVAALAGAFGALVAWLLRHPSIGFDGSIYHYPEVAGWIANGRPGSILDLSYDLPFGNYPLTDEVALTWMTGIARSWVPLYLWNPTMLVVLGVATWLTLRNIRVARLPSALACAGVLALPMVVHQLNEPQNDLPMMAWVACTAALATGARRRPELLVPAVVAAGLALGTKTTPAVVVLAALGTGLLLARGRLRPLAGWLAAAAVGAFAVGGLWYARNLFQHGSPFWPFTEGPWGDPRPHFLDLVDTTFLERPGDTLDGRLGDYSSELGGGWLLLAGALLVLVASALAPRLNAPVRRQLVLAGAVALIAFGVWSIAPGTGLPTTPRLFQPEGWPISTLRYLLPTLFVATLAVALATRVGGAVGAAASGILAIALGWSIVADARLGYPLTPAPRVLVAGAALGALAALAGTLAWRRLRERALAWRPAHAGALVVVAAVAAGVVLAPVSNGMAERHSRVRDSTALGRDLVAWFAAHGQLERGSETIAFVGRSLQGPLAGDHFTHPLELVPRDAPCSRVRAIARRSLVVVTDPNFLFKFVGVEPYDTHRCLIGRKPAYRDHAFTVYRPQ